ncbi:hypothetical protein JKP88DRAFT_272813 [Tribonema minus]|uniref:Fibronectin type-III domain-containing protein n=1 Tax=Tribonema minus TaxID=303371 RepID=A0A836CEN0_9STRA|nr:hypothetical protein JKP88DRAFT_272813 [Tribonema minus]
MAAPIATVNFKTDAYAAMSIDTCTFGSIGVQFTNPSSAAARFRVMAGAIGEAMAPAGEVLVQPGAKATAVVTGLTPGRPYTFGLQRSENAAYVDQVQGKGNPTKTTLSVDIKVSTSADSALVSWTDLAEAAAIGFEVVLTPAGGAKKTLAGTPYARSSLKNLLASDLVTGVQYTVEVIAVEGANRVLLGSVPFKTSAGAAIKVGTVRASTAYISWTGEESSVYRLVEGKTGALLADGLRGGAGLSLKNLVKATDYSVAMESLRVDGSSWLREGSASFTTASSLLTVKSFGTGFIALEWTQAYAGASYVLAYAAGAAPAVPLGTLTTSATSMTVSGLKPSTAYTFSLSAMEEGGLVGLAMLPMGVTADEAVVEVVPQEPATTYEMPQPAQSYGAPASEMLADPLLAAVTMPDSAALAMVMLTDLGSSIRALGALMLAFALIGALAFRKKPSRLSAPKLV